MRVPCDNLITIVFGASIVGAAAQGKARIVVPASEIVSRGPALVEVIPGVLATEYLAPHR